MAVLLVLLAGGGWWVVRGPMVGRPVALVPDIDLDSPAMRVAGKASDATPSGLPGQWSLAAAQGHTKPPASAASAASCGPDDGPKYGEPEVRDGVMEMDQVSGASPGYIAAQARLDAALRASPDPFDRAVADLLNAGDARTPTGRIDALVQQAVSTSDPRVYSLALHTCLAAGTRVPTLKISGVVPGSCASLTTRRWAALDPGNGVPWLAVILQAHTDKDAAGESDALAHLAAASRFDSHSMDVQAAVLSHVPADDPRLGDHLMAGALAAIALSPTSTERGAALPDACRNHAGGDDVRDRQCAAITATMYEHTDSVSLRLWAGTLTSLSTGDATRTEAARAESGAWSKVISEKMSQSPCGAVGFTRSYLVRAGQVGELAAMRELAASAPAKP